MELPSSDAQTEIERTKAAVADSSLITIDFKTGPLTMNRLWEYLYDSHKEKKPYSYVHFTGHGTSFPGDYIKLIVALLRVASRRVASRRVALRCVGAASHRIASSPRRIASPHHASPHLTSPHLTSSNLTLPHTTRGKFEDDRR